MTIARSNIGVIFPIKKHKDGFEEDNNLKIAAELHYFSHISDFKRNISGGIRFCLHLQSNRYWH